MTFETHHMSDEQIDKQITYAEGLRHGFEIAAGMVSKGTHGMMALTNNDTIKEWRRRENKLRDERSARAALARSQAEKCSDG